MLKYIHSIEENDLIEGKYQSLLRFARKNLSKEEIQLIRKAFEFLLKCHREQRKKSGELFVIHSIEVALIALNELSLGCVSVVSALFHNLILDRDVKLEEIEERFGKEISNIVGGLTRLGTIDSKKTTTQAENFRKLLLSLSGDVRVVLIKIADRLHNMRHLNKLPHDAQIRVANETLHLYSPTAHRLGLYKIKTELEDLSLKYSNPDMYFHISQKIQETNARRNKFIREFTQPIKKDMLAQGFEFEIKGRPKSIYSIYNKMRKQNIPFEEVFDQFAIRVIIDSKAEQEKADCWRVYSIVANHYQPNPERMRDWISVPKSNGYESLHTTVVVPGGKWVEVQIRTRRMDEIAEMGYAAHWKYKGIESDKGLEEWLARVRDILESPDADPDSSVDDLKLNLYNDEVFVFTPKGDLKRLPAGATVLDFAFEIHSDVGNQCIGARINGKNVPIRHELENGCRVEIITSKNQKSKRDWLEIVKTSKAKSKIKQILREEMYAEAENGREILERRLKNWKLSFGDAIVLELLKHYKYNKAIDLYFDIATGKLDLAEIKEVLTREEETESKKEEVIPEKEAKKTEKLFQNKDYLVIENRLDNVDYKLAKCCNPISGDDIFGFVSVGEGIKIHRVSCPNAPQLIDKYPYRVVKAMWKASGQDASFRVALKITGSDEFDMISRISDLISKDLKVHLRSISAESNEGLFEAILHVNVRNKDHLGVLIHKLGRLKGVGHVSRYDYIDSQ